VEVQPFKVAVDQNVLDDLKRRLATNFFGGHRQVTIFPSTLVGVEAFAQVLDALNRNG